MDGGVPGEPLDRKDWSINQPNPQLAAVMGGSGATLWTPDPDGMTRRLPLVISYEGKAWVTQWLGSALRLRPSADAHFGKSEFLPGRSICRSIRKAASWSSGMAIL